MKNLYRISEGEAKPATLEQYRNETGDGNETVYAVASDEREALRLARAYDMGDLQPGNVTYQAETIAALTFSREILVRQTDPMEPFYKPETPWYIADPDEGMPILSGTTDYLEFPTKEAAVEFVERRGHRPVFD